jgi:hypothetical protein
MILLGLLRFDLWPRARSKDLTTETRRHGGKTKHNDFNVTKPSPSFVLYGFILIFSPRLRVSVVNIFIFYGRRSSNQQALKTINIMQIKHPRTRQH